MIGRRPPDRSGPRRRRTGPPGEAAWWDPDDQTVAERSWIERSDFGRGWIDATMPNNAERLDPLGDDPDSAVVRAARARRRLTALDEGRAWRQRTEGSLAVLRVEVFATADRGEHRAAWRLHAEPSLDATWRARWRERDLVPGWIEARWVDTQHHQDLFCGDPDPSTGPGPGSGSVADAVDWLRVEDHTDPTGGGRVAVYEHLTVWAERRHVTVTVRHDLDVAVDRTCGAVAARLHRRLLRP